MMLNTPQSVQKTPRELLSDAAVAYGSALEYARYDHNPGAMKAAEDRFESLLVAAETYAAECVARWLRDRAGRTSSLVLRRTLNRLATEVIALPWRPARG